jgi:hypothetical protein
MIDLREALDLYDDMNDMIRHHMHSMVEDHNVSDTELTAEASAMAAILSLYANQILVIEEDPVMLPVYAFMCENLYNAISSVINDSIDNDLSMLFIIPNRTIEITAMPSHFK